MLAYKNHVSELFINNITMSDFNMKILSMVARNSTHIAFLRGFFTPEPKSFARVYTENRILLLGGPFHFIGIPCKGKTELIGKVFV